MATWRLRRLARSNASYGAGKQGALNLFGEPALELNDLMRTTTDGRGVVSVLASDKTDAVPASLCGLSALILSELFEDLPEVGDPDKPKLVFFFDEAHLLFRDAPKALLEKVEQGRAADPLERRWGVFHHAEPGRCGRPDPWSERPPGPARLARLYGPRSGRAA